MPRSAKATRRRILDAAYELFYRQGFGRVGVYEIAASAALLMEGTCTGEHAIGQGKMRFLEPELGRAAVETMGAIKRVLDPCHRQWETADHRPGAGPQAWLAARSLWPDCAECCQAQGRQLRRLPRRGSEG
jgi:FAD linked oxidases, C-terminal domain/Bacterial regulatory proteins, tetR family